LTGFRFRRRDDRRDERTRGRNAPQRADRTTSRHRTCQGLLEPDARKRARPVLIGGPASQGAGPTRRCDRADRPRSAGRRAFEIAHKRGPATAGSTASNWARAVVWRLAVFASCLRSEPVVSKRSGISLDPRHRLLERAMEANANRVSTRAIRAERQSRRPGLAAC